MDVTETLIELAETLVSDYDLLDYLDRLLERCAEVVGAGAGGVMLSDAGEGGRLRLLACTDEDTRGLELFELQGQEGPCVECHRVGAPVIELDLEASTAWPNFTPLVLERGFHAVYALPLRVRGTTIGALNLFLEDPGPVAPEKVRAAQAFADMASIGITQQRALSEARELASHLQIALDSRVVIEQAKGILSERLACGVGEAFGYIRKFARQQNRRLHDVAADVVASRLDATDLAGRDSAP